MPAFSMYRIFPSASLAAALLVVASACVGNVSGEYERSDSSVPRMTGDSSVPWGDADAGSPRDGGGDSSLPPPPPVGDSGTDTGVAVPDTGPPPPPPGPCDAVRCGSGAECNVATGECECADGYITSGTGCDPIPPGDPQGRTASEVCDAWAAGHVENARPAWTRGPTACDPGTLDPAAYGDTTRRINLFRWLNGLPAVTHDATRDDAMQDCAIMMDQQGALSHDPPATWACYTAAGAGAAGSSNLALGTSSPGAAIDLYMGDARVASLGHRRWVINPSLGRVGIGFAGRGQCLGVFDMSAGSTRPWTAFPNAGPTPVWNTGFVWSFHANSVNSSGVTVYMEKLGATPEVIPVTSTYIDGGFGRPGTVHWDPPRAAAGETYRITIGGLSVADITYEVEVVSCP